LRSLETKSVVINHDIAKLVGHYKTMVALCEYGTFKGTRILKIKPPQKSNFSYIVNSY
jgi:hypothetical protein